MWDITDFFPVSCILKKNGFLLILHKNCTHKAYLQKFTFIWNSYKKNWFLDEKNSNG